MDTSKTPRSIHIDSLDMSCFKPSEKLFTEEFLGLFSVEPISFASFQVNAIVDTGISREEDGISLKRLIRAVTYALESASNYCKVVDFNPDGCKWEAFLWYEDEAKEDEVSSVLAGPENDTGTHFCLYAACCEKIDESSLFPKYTIDIALMPPKMARNFVGLERQLMQMYCAGIFEKVTHMVKKAIIKLGFPRFSEGSSGKKFKEVYKVMKELSKGSYAKVFSATHRVTGNVVAVKAIQRSNVSAVEEASIMNEVSILSSLGHHPQIIDFIDFFEESKWYLIVIEFMEGGDLFDEIGSKSSYTEDDARNICKKLFEAVNYCHQNGVAHLDLKAKNVLLKNTDDDLNVKLGDFGFAERITGPKCFRKPRGSPFYVAPEIIRCEPFDERSDMWSLGVIIYLILSGKFPFTAKNTQQLFRKVVKGGVEFPDKYWKNVSEEAKEVVRNLIVTDPDKRWTATQALKSTWLSVDRNTLVMHELDSSAERLQKLTLKMTFKAAVIAVQWVNKLSAFSTSNEGNDSISGGEEEEESDSSSGSEL